MPEAGGPDRLRGMRDAVTVSMSAPPEKVWALVSDVTRIGEFSPETFEARWIRGASGPEVGAQFKGHVRRNGIGPVYWTLCRVTESDAPKVFAFTVVVRDRDVNTWKYEITPTATGCDVTESFSLAPNPFLKLYWAVLGPLRNKTNVEGMRQTLERIKAVVDS
jgi:uncharacterized protein YndB with AHSA1/START domain